MPTEDIIFFSIAIKLKDGTTQRYSHCAQNNAFKEQLTYISEQLEAPSL